MNPLLTIVTVCYNSEQTIRRCIDSVVKELNKNIEYLIIDGKSKDKTLDIVQEYNSNKIRYISEKDNGIYDAMNKGVKMANGKWIYFLNSDDSLKENVLEKVLKILRDSKYDCVYGDFEEILEYNGQLYSREVRANKKIDEIKRGMIFSHQSFFAKKELILECGLFDISFRIAGDWDLISKLYKKGYKFYHINEMIVNFYLGGASGKNHNLERHRVRKKNKLYKYIDVYFIRDMFYSCRSKVYKSIVRNDYNSRRLKQYKLKGYSYNL